MHGVCKLRRDVMQLAGLWFFDMPEWYYEQWDGHHSKLLSFLRTTDQIFGQAPRQPQSVELRALHAAKAERAHPRRLRRAHYVVMLLSLLRHPPGFQRKDALKTLRCDLKAHHPQSHRYGVDDTSEYLSLFERAVEALADIEVQGLGPLIGLRITNRGTIIGDLAHGGSATLIANCHQCGTSPLLATHQPWCSCGRKALICPAKNCRACKDGCTKPRDLARRVEYT